MQRDSSENGEAGQVGTGEYNRDDSRNPRSQETSSMIRRLAAAALLLVLFAGGCASSGGGPAETQEKFGVRMAKMNLWREAMFRFRRAVELTPEDAMAHNNLAVALEANGDFDGAGKAYREAMRLDRSNQFIQKNYSRFVEFTTRDRRRQQRKAPAPAAVTTAQEVPATEAGERPKPSLPAAAEPGQPPTPAEASDPDHGDPAPTSAAPAVTPAPNPAPAPTPPSTEASPGGGA